MVVVVVVVFQKRKKKSSKQKNKQSKLQSRESNAGNDRGGAVEVGEESCGCFGLMVK